MILGFRVFQLIIFTAATSLASLASEDLQTHGQSALHCNTFISEMSPLGYHR